MMSVIPLGFGWGHQTVARLKTSDLYADIPPAERKKETGLVDDINTMMLLRQPVSWCR